jgi:hypothetical protein
MSDPGMTVGQLIEMLSKFPRDTRIVLGREEGGFDDACECEKITIALSVHKKSYLGKHEAPNSMAWLTGGYDVSAYETADAIYIF